ncbi:MAG TPA: IclR family transcriptional regulator [Aliidongia sp.]|uniref:IclR family transcriptional regulator n=1 Tax=Aliidongia sp. TaxID=1914230 RepID=UPI002DDD4E6B|nr:IclR family transcriptional regulator [Aliidongia sp.]HEV2675942.1 IclR family transcriptional regulator [Aliidongia sp.]
MPVEDDAADALRRPGAPALEKGLDLLEALAAEPNGISQKNLAAKVGRSVGEIFRMLGALEQRGYVGRDPKTGEYGLSLRLFQLATQHPPARRLQQAALPVMEELAAAVGLSCHLSMLSGPHFLTVAQAESDRQMGWSVKLGALFPFTMPYVSARVLAAFQHRRRDEVMALLARESGLAVDAIRPRLDAIRTAGYDLSPSEMVTGLVDMSCPVQDHSGQVLAALTLPFLPQRDQDKDPAPTLARLRAAAADISEKIGAATA